ncbi:NADH dehydrogenase I subunit E [Proteiniborus sp. DW1]|uniref:NADH-quinone oxidoreductase subunit NuoE family protein n=1 Tax=Proteiniborus sp. DW1 TaxID=1889883 RepID=UPI00092DEAA1|nr:NAD(P)H-dependent oxidoreductase subunit E [Proteiniborus sp. DW1]SCG84560.1 NADH dehydrogenase I subunit E [Proteiniborus sp. DW1]
MDFKFDWKQNEEKIKELQKIIEKHKDTKGAVMPVLHEAQDLFGYLPIEVQTIISEGLNVPLAEIYGVVTFYSQFTLIPKGQYQIGVCLGTACYVKGSQAILDKIKEKLNVQVGGTTPDRKFSLQATRCIGACGLAPVITINEDVYGRLKAEEVEGILEKYLK